MIIEQLRTLYDTRRDEVESWLASARAQAPPFVTTSVDLRHALLRLVPVDTNLYPAGFQNLSTNARARAAQQFLESFGALKRVLIVPENHTRNLPYLDNLATLRQILLRAGVEVEIGNLLASEPVAAETSAGETLTQQPLVKQKDTLTTGTGFVPDVVLLNNDCSGGPPPLLEGISQPIVPPVAMGWYRRLKSAHFTAYATLAGTFAETFGLDPWTICAAFKAVAGLNFKAREGVDHLAREVDTMIANARRKHADYGITDDPFVYVKANSGTYGMGIMVVRSGAELLEMNKKERNKMHVIKEGVEVSHVILQEGIPTIDRVDGKPAEPMIYLVDGVPVGGMYRINANRDAYGNLNAAGMEFKGMCDEVEPTADCRQQVKDCDFRVYGLIATLAALAAGRESSS